MKNKERIGQLKSKDYQKYFGISKATFDQMIEILKGTHCQEHRRGGHPLKLDVLDKLVIMLAYDREYRTMDSIAFEYGVSKSTIWENIHFFIITFKCWRIQDIWE